MIRDLCQHCRKPIIGKGSATGVRVWKHYFPTGETTDCQTPEPRPPSKTPCTCWVPHYNCIQQDCKCEKHAEDMSRF